MEAPTAARTVGLMADPMVDLTAAPADLMVDRIMAIGSAVGPAGFMAIATSGIACGIAGIQSATTVRAGTFAAQTGNRRNELASGALPLAPLSRPNKYAGDNPYLQQRVLRILKE
jgi:hypothetical protein